MKKITVSNLISCFIAFFIFVSVSDFCTDKFVVPVESEALSTSEITDSITNLKNTRYPDGWSWHNEYSDAEATKIFNGSQCVGFARNLGNIIFGSFPNQGVLNFTTGQTLNGWTAIRGNDVTYVQPGDIIHVAGHAAMVYYLNGEIIYVAESWGSQNSIIKYGLFNGNWQGRGSTLAKLKSNYDFQGIWRYNGTVTPAPNLTSNITISGQTVPTALKKGSFFGIYGNIKSNLPITLVWGGVYRNDWTVTSQYAEAKPNTTSYSLYPYFDNNIVFNGLEEGLYHYLIKAKDTSGKEYTLINSEFTIGNPKSLEFKSTATSVSLNRSKGEKKQITFSYENYDGDVILSYEHGANRITDCEWGDWSGNSVPLIIEGYNNGTEIITIKMKNSDTEEVLKTINITITVTSDPLEFTASADSVNINGFESKKVTFSYKNYDNNVTIGFEHGENITTSLGWDGWVNNTDMLDIQGYARGEEIITVYLKDSDTDKIIASKKIKVIVTGIETELIASEYSLNIDMDKDEQKGITFSYKNLPAETYGCSIDYEHGEHRTVDAEWGKWNDHKITLYIKGHRTGTENFKVKLYDRDTDELLDEKTITVKVTGTPEIISSDDKISLNYNTKESKTLSFTIFNYPCDCSIAYVHGKNSITDCKWNGWNGDTDTLTITPTEPGNEIITVELRSLDEVIASVKVNVTVTAKCEVYFDSNGGVVNSRQTVTFNEPYGNLPIPSIKGYIFEGWYTEKNCGTKITEDTKVSVATNHTLYAHWTEEVIKGDCNDDGVFDVSDVVLLQRWLISDGNVTLKNWKNSDLYEDNKLDVFDLVVMKKQLIN